VSLLEVLISMFVLSVGLLGVAALIPVGRFRILEAGKADRSGACGQAALSEIKVRQMLNPYPWPAAPAVGQWVWANGNDAVAQALAAGSFAIDPLGVAKGLPATLGPIPRVTLRPMPTTGSPLTYAEAEQIFMWHDDLQFSLPEDMKPAPAGESDRPQAANYVDLNGNGQKDADEPEVPQATGHYSWLVTVTPAAAEAALPVPEKTLYSVSVVVCYRRDFAMSEFSSGQPEGEYATSSVEFLGSGYGGGSMRLTWQPRDSRDPTVRLRENEWMMLCGRVGGRTVCHWYRVVSADNGSPTSYVSLVGPDWNVRECPQPTAVAIDHVVGVYSTNVELDRDLLWRR
jgi:hypothetical protein